MKKLAKKIGFKTTKEMNIYFNIREDNGVVTLIDKIYNKPNRHFLIDTLQEVI